MMTTLKLLSCASFFVILLLFGCGGRNAQVPSSTPPDLSNHPVYSTYDFGQADNVIDIGVQPLYMPTGVISELMRRDRVLTQDLAADGLEIRFHPFLKGADVNYFLERGDLEAGVGGDMPALSAAARSKVEVTVLMQQGFSAIVATRQMLMRELAGQRIAYAFGSNAHYALLQALKTGGLSEPEVTLIPMDVDQMPDALAAGEIDAFSAWEPIPAIAIKRPGPAVIIHRSLTTGYLYFSDSLAGGHPEAVRHVTTSALRAQRWAKGENLMTACAWTSLTVQELTGRPPELDIHDLADLCRDDLLGLSRCAAIPVRDLAGDGRLSREYQFLKDLGKIPGQSTWDEIRSCFNLGLVDELLELADENRINVCDYEGSRE